MGAKYKTNHERMLELIEQLTKADIAYYRDDNPIMTDRDYDILMDELKDIESRIGLVLSGSRLKRCLEKYWKAWPRYATVNLCFQRIKQNLLRIW